MDEIEYQMKFLDEQTLNEWNLMDEGKFRMDEI
jgi:hypothetical protein